MEKELDLSFLKNMPKGRELYSIVHGMVLLENYDETVKYPICIRCKDEPHQTYDKEFKEDGRLYNDIGECVLFPSEECKDWENWRIVLIQEGDFIISKEYNVEYVFRIDGSFHSVAKVRGEFVRVMRSLNTPCITGWADSKQIEKFKEQLKEAGYEITGGIIKKLGLKEIERSEKFDPTTLQPFAKVLVRDHDEDNWECDLFSHYESNEISNDQFICIGNRWNECIPYNDDTASLVGTDQMPPEFYNIFNI